MKVEIKKLNNTAEIPKTSSDYAAAVDLHADIWRSSDELKTWNCELKWYSKDGDLVKNITINPGGRALIPTGIAVAIPIGYEMVVRPRSGLALKHGISIVNSPGTIDADYRGEIGVILINHGFDPITISQDDRIAQLALRKTEHISWEEVSELSKTSRGEGGFGSTGK